jgi:hypothetical protein
MHFIRKCKVSRKYLEAKNQKKSLPSAKFDTRQRPSVLSILFLSLSKGWWCVCRAPFFAECPTLSKYYLCQGPSFAECLALGKEALCRVSCFAECGSRQKDSLLSVRLLALGKTFDTHKTLISCSVFLAVVTDGDGCVDGLSLRGQFAPLHFGCRRHHVD